MDTRKYVWLAVLALVIPLLPPSAARAERPPSRPQDQLTMENDPWRPDTHDPGRALADRDQSVVDERSSAPAVREKIQRGLWSRILQRIVRLRFSWGIGR